LIEIPKRLEIRSEPLDMELDFVFVFFDFVVKLVNIGRAYKKTGTNKNLQLLNTRSSLVLAE
jgi:hypothetical protein